jgi:hypothetical protein
MIIEKRAVENYENSWHQEYRITVEYGFEKDIIETYLSQALKECKKKLRYLTKGENNDE